MSTNLEIEVKSKLSEDEYQKLLDGYKNQKTYIQTNYYLDDNLLTIRHKKCGLRVREKEGEFELTLKVPSGDGKIEINQQISNILFEKLQNGNIFPDGEIKQFLQGNFKAKIDEIHILGKLITTRTDITYNNSLISVDKSEYNGIIDYEIECEDSSKKSAKENLKDFLKKNGIKYRENKDSKLKRFLKSLNLCH